MQPDDFAQRKNMERPECLNFGYIVIKDGSAEGQGLGTPPLRPSEYMWQMQLSDSGGTTTASKAVATDPGYQQVRKQELSRCRIPGCCPSAA